MTDTPENQVTTEADEAAAEAEAERLFAEAAEAREGSQDDGSASKEDGPSAASKPDDDQPGKPGEGDGNGAEPGKTEGAAAEPPASGSGEFDWSKADPAARAAYEAATQQFEHRLKSANGRVSVLDRKLAELRKGTGGGEEQHQPRKPLKELLDNDQVQKLGEEYPDFKQVLETLQELTSRVDGVAEEVGQVRSTAVAAATAPQEQALNQAVPNWLDLAKDERFLGWVDDQPKKVRDAVSANWDAITNAAEAAEVFKSFAEHIAPPKQGEDQGGKGSSKRDRQQSGARAATVTSPTSAGGDSDDPDVVFAQAAAKKDRERGIRAT